MNKQLEYIIKLELVKDKDLALFQKKLKESFTKGLIESLGDTEAGPIPSDEGIQQSLNAPEAVIYHILLNDEKVK